MWMHAITQMNFEDNVLVKEATQKTPLFYDSTHMRCSEVVKSTEIVNWWFLEAEGRAY